MPESFLLQGDEEMPLKFSMNEIKCMVFEGVRYIPKRKACGYACHDCDLFGHCNPSKNSLFRICMNITSPDVCFKRDDGK